MILKIDKSIKFEIIKLKFDKNIFVTKLNKTDFPNKKIYQNKNRGPLGNYEVIFLVAIAFKNLLQFKKT